MTRVQQGDQDAYRALLDDIGPMLTRILRRWVRDPQEIEDVAQETLLAVHRARHTYHPSRPLEPWLFAIARHVAIEHGRRRQARLAVEMAVQILPERRAADAATSSQEVVELLRRLPPGQRQAFELLKLQGLSLAAGAARAGTTTGALKVRAHRAYKAIKALLQR